MVGSRRSDVPIRLWDGRLMPTECKVSNSSTNSYKRINNDAAVKAVVWRQEFGAVILPFLEEGRFPLAGCDRTEESNRFYVASNAPGKVSAARIRP